VETPVERMWACFEARDWAGARAQLDDEFECEWPPTGERFVGADAFIAMNEAYPDIGWHIEPERFVVAGEEVAALVRVPSDEGVDWCTGFYTLGDGKVWRAVEFWKQREEGPPPEWREPFRASADR